MFNNSLDNFLLGFNKRRFAFNVINYCVIERILQRDPYGFIPLKELQSLSTRYALDTVTSLGHKKLNI
jgi:hypothetical protein